MTGLLVETRRVPLKVRKVSDNELRKEEAKMFRDTVTKHAHTLNAGAELGGMEQCQAMANRIPDG